nr:hypothetical protein [Hoylesella enoeca]
MNKTKLIWAAALLLTAACANEDVNKDNNNDANKGLTAFVSGDEPATRTSMDHTAGGKGKFFWTTGDNIWIDNAGTPESSTSSSITGKTDYAKFYFASTFTGTSYPVTYTGKSSTKSNEVTIAANQTQSAPNNTDHFATSGDCGTATATGSGNMFFFKLKHQAAYLCLLPRNENTNLGANLYLQKIVVTSDNDIAGTYILSSAGLSTSPISSASNTITMNTGAGNGTPLGNSATDINNSFYMVIAPGTHALKIECYVKDPVTGVGTTLTQNIASRSYNANTITDITANVTPTRTIYPGNGYYMWDAQQHYWAGYEWDGTNPTQPTINGQNNSADAPKSTYYVSGHTPRDFNDVMGYNDDTGAAPAVLPSYTAAGCPNINEMLWYARHGDPHWDNTTLWVTMRHLYAGGMWIKKQSAIAAAQSPSKTVADLKAAAPDDGIDYTRSVNQPPYSSYSSYYVIQGKPSNLSDYFYLPALGLYESGSPSAQGRLLAVGTHARYWSSTPYPKGNNVSYALMFYSGLFGASNGGTRMEGYRLWKADDSNKQYRPNGM